MSTSVLPRLLRLLELLSRGRVVPGPELAVDLGVDQRTLRRDIERLRDLGYEVMTRRGRHGGYRLARQDRLPPLTLDQREAVGLVIGIEAALRTGLRVENAQRLADRVIRLLPADVVAAVNGVRDALDFGGPVTDGHLSANRLLDVETAAREARAIEVRYSDARGRTTERIVDAWDLVHHGRRWYLVGHDRLRDEVRTLRVDRMSGLLDAGPRQAEPPVGFDAAVHVNNQITRDAWRHPVEVVFDAPIADVRARLPPSVGDITDENGQTILRTGANDLRGMACLLAGTGLPCTIRTPIALADELTALGQGLIAHHQR